MLLQEPPERRKDAGRKDRRTDPAASELRRLYGPSFRTVQGYQVVFHLLFLSSGRRAGHQFKTL